MLIFCFFCSSDSVIVAYASPPPPPEYAVKVSGLHVDATHWDVFKLFNTSGEGAPKPAVMLREQSFQEMHQRTRSAVVTYTRKDDADYAIQLINQNSTQQVRPSEPRIHAAHSLSGSLRRHLHTFSLCFVAPVLLIVLVCSCFACSFQYSQFGLLRVRHTTPVPATPPSQVHSGFKRSHPELSNGQHDELSQDHDELPLLPLYLFHDPTNDPDMEDEPQQDSEDEDNSQPAPAAAEAAAAAGNAFTSPHSRQPSHQSTPSLSDTSVSSHTSSQWSFGSPMRSHAFHPWETPAPKHRPQLSSGLSGSAGSRGMADLQVTDETDEGGQTYEEVDSLSRPVSPAKRHRRHTDSVYRPDFVHRLDSVHRQDFEYRPDSEHRPNSITPLRTHSNMGPCERFHSGYRRTTPETPRPRSAAAVAAAMAAQAPPVPAYLDSQSASPFHSPPPSLRLLDTRHCPSAPPPGAQTPAAGAAGDSGPCTPMAALRLNFTPKAKSAPTPSTVMDWDAAIPAPALVRPVSAPKTAAATNSKTPSTKTPSTQTPKTSTKKATPKSSKKATPSSAAASALAAAAGAAGAGAASASTLMSPQSARARARAGTDAAAAAAAAATPSRTASTTKTPSRAPSANSRTPSTKSLSRTPSVTSLSRTPSVKKTASVKKTPSGGRKASTGAAAAADADDRPPSTLPPRALLREGDKLPKFKPIAGVIKPSTSDLNKWVVLVFKDCVKNPVPTEDELNFIQAKTNATLETIRTRFANMRKRHWLHILTALSTGELVQSDRANPKHAFDSTWNTPLLGLDYEQLPPGPTGGPRRDAQLHFEALQRDKYKYTAEQIEAMRLAALALARAVPFAPGAAALLAPALPAQDAAADDDGYDEQEPDEDEENQGQGQLEDDDDDEDGEPVAPRSNLAPTSAASASSSSAAAAASSSGARPKPSKPRSIGAGLDQVAASAAMGSSLPHHVMRSAVPDAGSSAALHAAPSQGSHLVSPPLARPHPPSSNGLAFLHMPAAAASVSVPPSPLTISNVPPHLLAGWSQVQEAQQGAPSLAHPSPSPPLAPFTFAANAFAANLPRHDAFHAAQARSRLGAAAAGAAAPSSALSSAPRL